MPSVSLDLLKERIVSVVTAKGEPRQMQVIGPMVATFTRQYSLTATEVGQLLTMVKQALGD